MYDCIFIDLDDRESGTFTITAASIADALVELRASRGVTERESLLRFHLCQTIDTRPQVGLVTFADGSRYCGTLCAEGRCADEVACRRVIA